MKNLTNILRRSNLNPFEKVKALVHNDVHREKTGKDVLSESDIHNLTKGWTGNTSEINEYNKYINIVQVESLMKMDAQMFLYRSEIIILRNQRILDNFISRMRLTNSVGDYSFMKDITIEENISFLIKNTYLEYDKTLHIFTFNNLPKVIQNDLLLLDEEIINDGKYLDDQVFLYERFKNGNKLSKEDKDLIIERIYSDIYFEGAKKIKNSTDEKDGFHPHAFFAELPVKDLFEKLAKNINLIYDDEKDDLLSVISKYAKNKDTSIEKLIKDTISHWLDSGLFVVDYSPLFVSKKFNTWNGDTNKNHKELFVIWYKELQKSKKYFQKLFYDKKLKRKILEKDFLGTVRITEVITGESLYVCKENIDFVKNYKKQIEIFIPMSNIFLFIQKYAVPIKNYKTLCEFKNLAQKTSSIFDIDMTERYVEFISSYEEEITLLNINLNRFLDTIIEKLYCEKYFQYILYIKDNSFNFDVGTDSGVDNIIEKYGERFDELKI